MRIFSFLLFPILVCAFAASCSDNTANNAQISTPNKNTAVNATPSPTNANADIPVYSYDIVNTYRHDDDAFTQGLVFHENSLYESTGQHGDSSLRKVELETGKVKEKRELEERYFGEGMTILNGKIYQITWQDGVCFVYDLNTLQPLSLLAYNGEGWGLTNDGASLIMSDGSDKISFRDPQNFRVTRTVNVTHNGKPLYFLNELEYVRGEVWANIWHSEEKATSLGERGLPNIGKPNYIARINPTDGKVVGWIDLNGISPEDVSRDRENTLNGIAYDAVNDRLFVTGKRWKKLFEIKIKPKS